METYTVILILGVLSIPILIHQRLNNIDRGGHQFIDRPRNSANPIAEALAQGHRAYGKPFEKPFYIFCLTKKFLILPSKYLDDIRRASRHYVSFQSAINQMFFQYKWLDNVIEIEFNRTVIFKGINPQLSKMSAPLIEESGFALKADAGSRMDGKEMSIVELANDVSLRTFSRVLGGRALSCDQTYIDAFNAWSSGNIMTGFLILTIPSNALRHILVWPLAMYQKHVRQRRLHNLAKLHVIRRIKENKSGSFNSTEIDALQLAMKLSASHPVDQSSDMAQIHLLTAQLWQLTWAGAQSPSMILANMLVKVLETPAHGELLREEAKAAVKIAGWSDAMLNHMPIMDSFIREVHRLCPILSLNAQRMVMKQSFAFSDGLTLPKGTLFAFPSFSCALDSDLVANPEEFDPRRFSKLFKQDDEGGELNNRWAASQIGPTNMAFGYGNYVCPGRFLAVRGLKIIFARILIEYDISWKFDGGKAPNMVMEGFSIPDPNLKVTMKQRAVNS